jgi:hypothetical protein
VITFPAYALDLVCGEEASENILKILTQCLKVKVFIRTHLELAHLQKQVEKKPLCKSTALNGTLGWAPEVSPKRWSGEV